MWIVILFGFAILVFLEVIRELHCFQVTEYVVESDKLTQVGRELCVLFLSDLHNHVYGKENEKLRKAIVEAHKGEIKAFNNDLGGATFELSLPLEEENNE